MAHLADNRRTLRVEWSFSTADDVSARIIGEHLTTGHEKRVFTLHSWNLREGAGHAILTPESPLEDVVAVIWGTGQRPVALSAGEDAPAAGSERGFGVTRELRTLARCRAGNDNGLHPAAGE
jgi:hypothetical protein